MATRMDPQLFEELARGDDEAEIDAIIRLWPNRAPPEQVRIVSRFGDIATCRMKRGDIIAVRQHPSTRSLKASRRLNNDTCTCGSTGDSEYATASFTDATERSESAKRRRPRARETGRGVVIGVVDYGCDFAHKAFRNSDGTTRLLKLWDQRPDPGGDQSVSPYDRGRVFERDAINEALGRNNPYEALDYHPAPEGRKAARKGAHGTHVLDIAAGNGSGIAPRGMAPKADIIFVHVASGDTGGLHNFGDSVGVLEAIDFITREAGDRPCVINISMGRHGGPHDGSTLAEQAIDTLLTRRKGLFLVQSAGNYFGRSIHASGTLREGASTRLGWQVYNTSRVGSELEIWYPGADAARVEIKDPKAEISLRLAPGDRKEIRNLDGGLVGRAYARIGDPGNADNHIDIFLYRGAPTGQWSVTVTGEDVSDGRWHAWIERIGGTRQPRFTRGPVSDAVTCGTIAHARNAIQVAAHNDRRPPRMASFSSAGPSRDGRDLPMIAAPGVKILAARSAIPGRTNSHEEATRKSGTSMAAPYVSGLVALMLEAAPDASQKVIRRLLELSARPMGEDDRTGVAAHWGAVRPLRAIRFARRWQRKRRRQAQSHEERNHNPYAPTNINHNEDTMEQTTLIPAPISSSEWTIIANWIGRGLVPTDGTGAFRPGITPADAVPLSQSPTAAASAIARALTAYAARSFSGTPYRSSNRSALRILAGSILPAVPPTASEWRMLGEFMERETTLNRTTSRTRSLFGTNDADNRRDMAHFLACARLQSTLGSTMGTNYCNFPVNSPDPAIQILAQSLSKVGALLDWPQISLDQRRVYVMSKLVTTYGYSREAAAGIVGNLEAESGVMPERVEGSGRATPRYSRDWNGRRVRHTAADIQNRSRRARTGPRRPGIGLAQWTSGNRRRGMYAFAHVGIAPGEFIIYFMDHQIAYLVHELATSYRRLDRQLRRPGVSVDDASDGMIYDFERPGSILEPDPNRPGRKRRRPRSDPQVQEKLRERRQRSHRALRAYDATVPRGSTTPQAPQGATRPSVPVS
ncbi:MAG: phage tail tip lysozyme [Pseudomonadota bacterium]